MLTDAKIYDPSNRFPSSARVGQRRVAFWRAFALEVRVTVSAKRNKKRREEKRDGKAMRMKKEELNYDGG